MENLGKAIVLVIKERHTYISSNLYIYIERETETERIHIL